MQMNSSSTRFLVACRDAGIARAGISPQQSRKQSAASPGLRARASAVFVQPVARMRVDVSTQDHDGGDR